MALSGQTLTIIDPGLGLSDPLPDAPVVLGTCSAGTVDTLYTFNQRNSTSALGDGPLVQQIERLLSKGGTVRGMRLTGSVAGTNGSVTPTRVGSSTGTITLAGAPYDYYQASVEILTDGSVASGGGTFRYSLDNENTWSATIVIPSGATYLIPNTNITMTFVDGAGPAEFEDGDKHAWVSVAPYYGTSDLASAVTALLANSTTWAWVDLEGRPASASAAATMFSALQTHMTTFAASARYAGAMMDAGNDTAANVITSVGAVSGLRVLPAYSTVRMPAGKAFAGYGSPLVSASSAMAYQAHGALISTALSRRRSGAVGGISAVTHDEQLATTGLQDHRIATFRTVPGLPGFYIEQAWIKSAPGSDFTDWHLRRIMDAACATVVARQNLWVDMVVRSISGGFIDPRDGDRLEREVLDALKDALLRPNNIEGSAGHVSDVQYAIKRDNNIVSSRQLQSEVRIRPHGYPRYITTQIGFTLS